MRFFQRKKKEPQAQPVNPRCPQCRSANTGLIAHYSSDQPDYIKTWRGQRYVTCRCFDCGRDFYTEEPPGGLSQEAFRDEAMIDDEGELQAAEDELRRQIEEEDDRRFG